MKRICNFLTVLLIVLLLTACGGGDVSEVGRQIKEGGAYNRMEIARAMNEVEGYFEAEFDGCKLLSLCYDEEKTGAEAAEWAAQYGTEEAIVLLSDFEVGSSGGDGSLNPDSTYRNWKWILTRDGKGEWELRTWGYG